MLTRDEKVLLIRGILTLLDGESRSGRNVDYLTYGAESADIVDATTERALNDALRRANIPTVFRARVKTIVTDLKIG